MLFWHRVYSRVWAVSNLRVTVVKSLGFTEHIAKITRNSRHSKCRHPLRRVAKTVTSCSGQLLESITHLVTHRASVGLGGSVHEKAHPCFSAKANSAFHPSGVGKWVPASAGKAKASIAHSVSGWTRGVQVKLWDPLRTCAIPERLRGAFTTRRYTNPPLPLPLPSLILLRHTCKHWCWKHQPPADPSIDYSIWEKYLQQSREHRNLTSFQACPLFYHLK